LSIKRLLSPVEKVKILPVEKDHAVQAKIFAPVISTEV
jgi:hypothetical protein